MTEDELAEHFLDSFEKFYSFLRPHAPREYIAVKAVGGIANGKCVKLDIWHYSTLILISLLTANGEKSCLQPELEEVFLWKYPRGKSKFHDSKGVLNTLEATGLIERHKETDPEISSDRRRNSVRLTQKGKELIGELREARRDDVLVITSSLRLKNEVEPAEEEKRAEERAKVAVGLTNLANELWKFVLVEASKGNSVRRKRPSGASKEVSRE